MEKKFIPGKSWIPVSGAVITDEDKEILHEVVEKGWYTEGRYCNFFEEGLKTLSSKRFVRLVNSGSSASLIAMTAALRLFRDNYGIKNFVVTCACGFPTTVFPIIQNNAIPIFVDINPYTLQPDYQQITDIFIKKREKIVGSIFTHTLGFPYDEELVSCFFRDNKERFLISDCCDALGSYEKRSFANEYMPVGYYADISTHSFFPAHHITSAEGGAVVTNNPELDELARCYSNWGRSCYCKPGQSNTCGKRFSWEDRGELPEGWDHKYIFSEVGYNLKMTEFQGALGYSQSLRLGDMNIQRRHNYTYLLNHLYDAREFFHFIECGFNVAPFGFPLLRLDDAPFTTNEFVEHLENHKIRTRRLFGGNLTKQPAFKKYPSLAPFPLPGSDKVMNDMIWIGCHPALTYEMLDYVIEIIHEFIKGK